jgi:hypothetical protein
VLIGNHNNDWARRLTQNLRYRFDFGEEDGTQTIRVVAIVDAQQPDRKIWQVKVHQDTPPVVDYAVAGRFLDPVTGSLVLYVAGAGAVGTEAASELITTPGYLKNLPEKISDPKVNFEVVLKTPIVTGIPGAPEVIATDIQEAQPHP